MCCTYDFNCPICSDNKFEFIWESKFPLSMWPCDVGESERIVDFKVIACSKCGFISRGFYSDESLSTLYSLPQFVLPSQGDTERRKNDLLEMYFVRTEKLNREIKILEIGGGRNSYLPELSAQFETTIIDFSFENPLFKDGKCRKILGSVLDQQFEENFYDYIVGYQTLEHLPKVSTQLEYLRRALKDNGILIIEVPNLEYLSDKMPFYMYFPQHLSYFTSFHLKELILTCGFKILKVDDSGPNLTIIAQKSNEISDLTKDYTEGKMISKKITEKRLASMYKLEDLFSRLMELGDLQIVGAGGSLTCLLVNSPVLANEKVSIFDRDQEKIGNFVPGRQILIKNVNQLSLEKNILFFTNSTRLHYSRSEKQLLRSYSIEDALNI